MSVIATARRTSSATRQAFLVGIFLLPAIDLSLRIEGYVRARRRWVPDRPPALDSVAPEQAELARQLATGVAIAARRIPWPATCLRQAILLERLLTSRGIPCVLRIGVSNDALVIADSAGSSSARFASAGTPPAFGAHAWVEVGGEVVLGGSVTSLHYHPLL